MLIAVEASVGCCRAAVESLTTLPPMQDPTDRLSLTVGADNTVELAGELDAHTAPALEAVLGELDVTCDVRLVLAGVTFIDSSGLRQLIGAESTWSDHGVHLVLVEPSASVTRLLELTSLQHHFHVE